uniref:G-protein coupled receptors family 3 profile domain-containing protein n=1 Tax=Xenopus tropicalis TaxID=8364 RepID=F6PPK2_XENTR
QKKIARHMLFIKFSPFCTFSYQIGKCTFFCNLWLLFDLIITFDFPQRFHLENFQQFQALVFAVDEINRNPDILPNITLGFQVFDSCNVLRKDLEGTLQILTGYNKVMPNYLCLPSTPLIAVIGSYVSTPSIMLAHILGLYRYPQVSHSSTSPLLSNRKTFPSFFRTVPTDAFQSKGMAKLVLHFGWTWVGLLALDNDYGQIGIQLVKQEIIKAGACVAFSETIIMSQPDRNAKHIVNVIKESTATTIIVFSLPIDLVPILEEMLRENITDKMLVACQAWSTSSLFSDGKYSKIVSGTIGLALHSGSIPGFREFLNKAHPFKGIAKHWLKLLWENMFSCQFLDKTNSTGPQEVPTKECTGEETLESINNNYNDVSSLRRTYNIYTATHIVAKALEDLKSCKNGDDMFSDQTCTDIRHFNPWQVKIMLNSGRELFFDENGDIPAIYDIVNWKVGPGGTIKQVKVGSYDTTAFFGQVFTINTSAILWIPVSVCSQSCPPGFRKVPISEKPACCFQCIPCPQGEISNHTDSVDCAACSWDEWPNLQRSSCIPKTIEYLSYEDPLGAALAYTGSLSSLVPVLILRLFITYRTTPIVKANNYSLSCLLLLCLSLCFLCSLAFIGYPQPVKCLLRQVAFVLVFTLCVACILAKTILVVLAFMATKPGSKLKKWTSPYMPYVIISFGFFVQCILCMVWLLMSPPFKEYNIQLKPGHIIVDCNNGSPTAFWSVLAYLGLLATISFIVAFLARRLPGNFNEAKFITFSMLAFLSVWVSFIPASLSAQGKYTEAMEIFAILSSSWALLGCMFIPKCFILLFRPNMNSKTQVCAAELPVNYSVSASESPLVSEPPKGSVWPATWERLLNPSGGTLGRQHYLGYKSFWKGTVCIELICALLLPSG